MGYTTDFTGAFTLDKPLEPRHATYLTKFSETRRMYRKASVANEPDPIREAVGLPVGDCGSYYVGSPAEFGQDYNNPTVSDSNRPPAGQPGLWCDWAPTKDGTGIEWNGGEKFYHYVNWLAYLIDHFLKPWGYTLNGTVEWQGEDREDIGTITVENNVVTERKA
jgi:hypothetical protein